MRLKNKVAMVTGGNRGIGRAIVELFVQEGANVVALDLSAPDEPFQKGVTTEEIDVANEEDWQRVVASTLERHGRIDILVNNAGIATYESAHMLDVKSWERVIGVNQTGVFLGTRAVIPTMQQQKTGSIVNLSSIWGNAAVPGAHAYHATKGAVRTMTKNVAITYVSDGIRCNSVHPGITDTPLVALQASAVNDVVVTATPMKRKAQPVEIAYGVLFLASDEASYVTGIELPVDGGYLAQ
ncbi:SDR family NAD(P)-dependent oxidoreductase [Paraburkholderia sp. J63]|uniref:SDR family NAD(P)-dependent oxidoreductase n=1 Tax=Paraburkholderia sp. J63 TaxID=2805434 RepID=UPI002ABDF629|nr:SDR family oxidoreductase [Paraburkholderia sp. J63]